MKQGKLIVIEGACDGIGKSTQFDLLCKYFEDKGEKVVKHHFPTYESYQGEGAKRYLKGEFGDKEKLSPFFVNTLYAFDRAITWQSELKVPYEEGKTIVLDRYTTSSMIYQPYNMTEEERDYFLEYAEDYEYKKIGVKKPDIVIFLTADYDLVCNLREKRNEDMEEDIHERDKAFMKKVYDNANYVAKRLGWTIINCDSNNSFKSIEDIHKEIVEKIKENN